MKRPLEDSSGAPDPKASRPNTRRILSDFLIALPDDFDETAFNAQIKAAVSRLMMPNNLPDSEPKEEYRNIICSNVILAICMVANPPVLRSISVTQLSELVKTRGLYQACRSSIESENYMLVLDAEQPQDPPPPLWLQGIAAVTPAWSEPFIGNNHTLLLNNIRVMDETRRNGPKDDDRFYMNQASIIQSSGSGKSRLVDEVARSIFTIPFNLRPAGESIQGAYPPPDSTIRNRFVAHASESDGNQKYRRYLCILTETFRTAREFLKALNPSCKSLEELASIWREHLENLDRQKRKAFFEVVESKVNHQIISILAPLEDQYSKPITNDNIVKLHTHIDKDATDVFDSLLAAIHDAVPASRDMETIKVMLYFDEAHILTTPLDNSSKLPLDYLSSALNTFRNKSLFALFLSTQSDIEYLAPSLQYARSARYRVQLSTLHAPITETPVDCFGEVKISPSRLMAHHPSDIVFMSLFGRPLWRSVLREYTGNVLDQINSRANTRARFESSDDREGNSKDLINFARSKLTRENRIDLERGGFTSAAQTACVDVRLMLSYEPGRFSAQRRQMELISSHMRTVFSISNGRELVRSGYLSEPILAEAAARQLHRWSKHNGRPITNPVLLILTDNLEHDLLSRGEIGEVVGRSILLTARDKVTIALGGRNCHFSRPVPAIAFLEELFPPNIASSLLDSKPDNMAEDYNTSLRSALKDAVINFTHFSKWADDSAPSQDAALAAYIRSMAIICRNSAKAVDAFIPIVLDKNKPLSPENMTGILVQFKLRNKPGSTAAYEILQEDVGLFPPDTMVYRPYVTLVMELGVTSPPPMLTKTPTNPNSREAQRLRKLYEQAPVPDFEPLVKPVPSTPSKVNIPQPRRHRSSTHPRYSIFVYGCSPTVYKVIHEEERDSYRMLLRSGELLAEHPRQDIESLKAVRSMKPFFAVGRESFHWIENEVLNPSSHVKDEATTHEPGAYWVAGGDKVED